MSPDKLQEFALSEDELKNITGGVSVVRVTHKSEHSSGSSVIRESDLAKFKEKHEKAGDLDKYTFSEPYEWTRK